MNYTPKQLQVLTMVYDYQNEHGYSPTYAELAKELNVSTITVFEHLEALERKGAIHRRRHEARSVEIVETDFLNELEARKGLAVKRHLTPSGTVTVSEKPDLVQVTEMFAYTPQTSLMKVQGNALSRLHVLDGDLLVLDERAVPSSGDLVVAGTADGPVTLRTYQGEGADARLVCPSGAEPPLSPAQAKIYGVYKGLIRPARARAASVSGAR